MVEIDPYPPMPDDWNTEDFDEDEFDGESHDYED
jgi:hypothetical protein